MAYSTTTKEVITNNARLKVYETLEVKRRFVEGFEADWFDISDFLLFENATSLSQLLDFESFGYGQFKTGTANFTLDNSQGTFNNEEDLYSIFSAAISRHYTKVRYTAGYKDEDGDNITEVVFEGLINGKTIVSNFETSQITFTVLAYEQILSERTISESSIVSSVASDIIEDIFNADTTITDFIIFNSSNINPGNDLTFDDGSKFETRKVSDVLNDIAQKTNSVWFINSSINIIFRSREPNANAPFEFIGGARQSRSVNILNIEFYDDGFTKIINEIKYTSGSNIFINSSTTSDNLEKFGTNQLPLSGEDLTTQLTIDTLSADIIADNEDPKQRVVLNTVYMPNVVSILDKCTIDYKPDITSFGLPLLVFNDSVSEFNNSYFFGSFVNRNIIKPNITFKYMGFNHDIKNGITKHFLIEN